jgi:hypothetical protein
MLLDLPKPAASMSQSLTAAFTEAASTHVPLSRATTGANASNSDSKTT